jgi:hypothetical protein
VPWSSPRSRHRPGAASWRSQRRPRRGIPEHPARKTRAGSSSPSLRSKAHFIAVAVQAIRDAGKSPEETSSKLKLGFPRTPEYRRITAQACGTLPRPASGFPSPRPNARTRLPEAGRGKEPVVQSWRDICVACFNMIFQLAPDGQTGNNAPFNLARACPSRPAFAFQPPRLPSGPSAPRRSGPAAAP